VKAVGKGRDCTLLAGEIELKRGRGSARRGLLGNSSHDMKTRPLFSLVFRTTIKYIKR